MRIGRLDEVTSIMKLPKVEFAPLNVPLERRLQTLAVAAWFVVGAFGAPISWCLTVLGLVFGSMWLRIIIVCYLAFAYLDQGTGTRGGRSKWLYLRFRNFIWWRYFCSYFPIKIVKTAELDPSRNYLFCSFPHGLLATGVTGAFATNGIDAAETFPGLDFRVLTLDQHFQTPLFREYVLSFGVCSCNAKSISYLLSTKPTDNDGPTEERVTGRAVILIVGGAAEALKCKPRTYNILLKKRKGFVKVALINGAPLVPVFSFGETDLYDQFHNPEGSLLRKCQEYFKRLTGIAPVIPIGRGFFQYTFGLVPKRKPIHVVVGSPLELPRIANPSREDIDEYHGKFTEKLLELFETHKSKYIEDHDNVSITLDDH